MKYILVIVFFVICGCSKLSNSYEISHVNHYKVFANDVKQTVEKIQIELLTEIFTDNIDANRLLDPIWIDCSRDNIYILDKYDLTIKKYDFKGNYICKIGQRGQGPGEYTSARSFTIVNDSTIIVSDQERKIYPIFDTEGNFINNLNSDSFITSIKKAKNGIVGNSFSFKNTQNGTYIITGVSYLDMYGTFKSIANKEFKLDDNFQEVNSTALFTANEKEIIISWKSSNSFSITAYDYQADIGYIITKNYREIQYTDSEILEMKTLFPSLKLNNKKYSIRDIFSDYKQRIWVERSLDANTNSQSIVFDVFSEGIFYSNVILPNNNRASDILNIQKRIFLSNNYLFLIQQNNNNNQSVFVYRIID